MSSIVGNILKISLFGESHGEVIGMTINNFPCGVKLPYELINKELLKRKSIEDISTPRNENDNVEFISGVLNDVTTGAPLTFIIRNKDVDSSKYQKGVIRPSHADLTAYLKYAGYNDYRGGGHFSGRVSAPISVLGALCKSLLLDKDIIIGSHIKKVFNLVDDDFDYNNLNNSYYYTYYKVCNL